MIEARHGFTSHCPRSSYAPSFLLAWKMEIQSITALCQHMLVRLGVVPVTNATLAPYNQLTAPHQRVQASLGVVPVTNTTLAVGTFQSNNCRSSAVHSQDGRKKENNGDFSEVSLILMVIEDISHVKKVTKN